MSRQPGAWLAALLASFCIAGCATAPTEVQRLQARASYERGIAHLRDKQAASALNAIQEAIALDGTVAVYRNALGLLYLELRRPDLALEELRKATDMDASYAEAHLNTGIALAETSRWEEAAAAYRRAIAMPTLAIPHIAYQNLGLALYHLKRHQDAEQALKFALSLEPQMEAAYYNLGLVFVAQGRKDDARAAFRRARDLAPQSPFGQAAIGQLRALGEGG